MERVAFKMKLFDGYQDEYLKRHAELWPDLRALLKETGIEEYSIFLDKETNDLFGYLKISDRNLLNKISCHPIIKRWWSYMKGIMVTNEDHSPLTIPLQEVFYLS
jgi:L-rhamnose mutarotase